MQSRVKKLRRRGEPGEITVEQTRDLEPFAAILAMAKLPTAALRRPGSCVLVARWGAEPAGVAAVETALDIALARWLWVAPGLRRRGIGTALFNGVREAARARGARQLHALTANECDKFMERGGFVAHSISAASEVLSANFELDYEREDADFRERRTDQASCCRAWILDMSNDGIVVR